MVGRTFLVTFVGIIAIALMGCQGQQDQPSPTDTATTGPAPTPTTAAKRVEANFQFLVSDEENAIGDFQNLIVVISNIGLRKAGDSDEWLEFTPEITEVDLTQLQGVNAQTLWEGNVEPGTYTKVFIYIDQVTGVLEATGETIDVKLPSNKLRMSLPVEVATDTVTSFVYDLTVMAAGNEQRDSIKYILKPQIGQSGTGQKLSIVKTGKTKDGLNLALEGEATPGQEVSLSVATKDGPVEGATVSLNGDDVGVTNAEGRIVLLIPEDAAKVEIEAQSGESTGELEIEFPEAGEAVPEATDTSGTELSLELEGDAAPGEEATLLVTYQGVPVEEASVSLNGQEVGTTDSEGRITMTIPGDAAEVKIVATQFDLTGELEVEFPDSGPG